MRSGKLRYRVSIQTRAESVNAETGAITHTWSTWRTQYADIQPLTGRERLEAEQVRPEQSYKIVMRYFEGLRGDMRILIPGQRDTLNGSIDDTTTTVTINNAFTRPNSGDYYVRVEDEEMEVTGGHATTSLTVTRGANGTSGAAHADEAGCIELVPLQINAVANVGTRYREYEVMCTEGEY